MKGSWVWRVLGILLGTATLISLVKNGFAIELYGLPAKVFQQYTWLRDMLFEPVVWVLRCFGLTMPWWLKDTSIAYGLVAAAYWRAFPWESIALRLLRSALWPLYLSIIYGSESEVLRRTGRPMGKGYLGEDALETNTYDAATKRLAKQIVLIVVSAAAFFLWDHLRNAFGSGG